MTSTRLPDDNPFHSGPSVSKGRFSPYPARQNQVTLIVDVEPTPTRISKEVDAAETMVERTEQCFGLKPDTVGAGGRSATDTNVRLGSKTDVLENDPLPPAAPASLPPGLSLGLGPTWTTRPKTAAFR